MISMWALVEERDVEAYAGTLILPTYLSHLQLAPFKFAEQPRNRDGREPLKITYVAEGRLEEYLLHPKEHALELIRFVCPGIDTSRIQMPQDDASWHWTASGEPLQRMRVYFEPITRVLSSLAAGPVSEASYLSVSRGHVFIDRAMVESYIKAWIERLGVRYEESTFEFGTPSGGIDFTVGPVGGQMFLDDVTVAKDLVCFARLDTALAHVEDLVELDPDSSSHDHFGIYEDGIYIRLTPRNG